MKRLVILVGTVAAGIAVVAMASSTGQDVLGARLESRLDRNASGAQTSAESSPSVELRRATRWKCIVRHAKTQNDYKCTKRTEKSSCRCAIQQCKHWNPGHERHCSSACRCSKQ